jgi:hypothetical protein
MEKLSSDYLHIQKGWIQIGIAAYPILEQFEQGKPNALPFRERLRCILLHDVAL